jgi:branched-chain amino acid transport system substrate-binding protein
MRKRVLAVTMMLALAASALAGGTASAETEYKGTIKLGGLAPLTGNYAEYGKGFEIGFNKAIEEINEAGGANGYKLEIDIKDTQGDAVTSSTMATAFAEDDDILAILGDFTSGACKANAEICDRYGIVQLSPTASASDYASMSKYCFGIMGRQDVEAPFLAKYILKNYLGATKIAVIRVDSDWGQSCYDNFIAQAEIEGLDVTVEKYASGEKDFSSLITKMQAIDPDVLVVMDQGDAVAQIFNQADAAGWEITHVALGPGTSEQVAGQLIDQNNLIVTSPFFFNPDDEELVAWSDWFTEEAGFAPTIHPACAYDCVYLIAEAIEAIGDGEVTRDAIQENLANLEPYEGITGTIQFNEDGDISRNYMICGIEDGQWKVLEGFEYGAAGF